MSAFWPSDEDCFGSFVFLAVYGFAVLPLSAVLERDGWAVRGTAILVGTSAIVWRFVDDHHSISFDSTSKPNRIRNAKRLYLVCWKRCPSNHDDPDDVRADRTMEEGEAVCSRLILQSSSTGRYL